MLLLAKAWPSEKGHESSNLKFYKDRAKEYHSVHSNVGYCFVDSTLTAHKVALLWTILCTNRHDTLT